MSGVNFYYVDDSGDDDQTLLTAVEIPVEHWAICLKVWLGWRKALFRKHRLPASFEIHTGEFLRGKGDPAPVLLDAKGAPLPTKEQPRINTSKGLRREIIHGSVAQIGLSPRTRFFTIYAEGTDKMALYRDLLEWIEQELVIEQKHGLMLVDGIDSNYRLQHRALPIRTRRIMEDVWMQDSVHSQFIQVADIAVHAAFQGIVQNANKRFAWNWYQDYLTPLAVEGSNHPSRIKGL